jgi:signal transduction histidine kinase
VTTAAGTFVFGLALNLLGLTGVWPFTDGSVPAAAWWHTAFLAIGCAAMLGKRRHPMVALVVGLLAVAADLAIGGSVGIVLVLFDLLFSAGLFATARARTALMTAVFVTIGTGAVVGGLATADARVMVMIGLQLTGLLVVPLWWAANLRQQRQLGELNAARARREAIDSERSAMARDLHDVIASHLSTTALHSAAALALPADAERDRAALRAVRASSLAALEEMRTMIMLLRADGGAANGEVVAAARLERLPELVAQARATGLDVTLDGLNPADVPALVDQAGYRIVHEALANARKHAPGCQVRVALGVADDHLVVTVTNTVTKPAPLGHDALSAGTGLWSMAERAAHLGGEVTAGPDGQMWRVRAILPLRSPALVPAGSDT